MYKVLSATKVRLERFIDKVLRLVLLVVGDRTRLFRELNYLFFLPLEDKRFENRTGLSNAVIEVEYTFRYVFKRNLLAKKVFEGSNIYLE